tara:strand:- start:39 stop:491 length:453 start_codon:yes stop_codon:yes gene_type:complete
MNFKLHKKHKGYTKARWKQGGLIWSSEEEFEEIYQRYFESTHCELCNKPYKNSKDRNMDHIHLIDNKFGWFRNIVCTSCNKLRSDNKIRSDNASGYIGIGKYITKNCKQGFIWNFRVTVNGKQKTIKSSIDFDKLVIFAEKWKIDNKYYT